MDPPPSPLAPPPSNVLRRSSTGSLPAATAESARGPTTARASSSASLSGPQPPDRGTLWRASPYTLALRAARASQVDDRGSPRSSPAAYAAAAAHPPTPRLGSEASEGEEESEDDYAADLERLVEAAAGEEGAVAAGALASLQGVLEYTLRHDEGMAATVAGHVTWLLLKLLGPWADVLHPLLALSSPAAALAQLRAIAAATDPAGSEAGLRRVSQHLCCPGAIRAAAAVLPHLPHAPLRAAGADGSAGTSGTARVLLLAALWQALAQGPTPNAAAAARAGVLLPLIGALAHAAMRHAALTLRLDEATVDGGPAAMWRAAAEDARAEAGVLEEALAAAAAFGCDGRSLRAWLARAGRAPGARLPLVRALEGALNHPHGRAPAHVFLLDGEASGLLGLPSPSWPFAAGFAFATWICLESLAGSEAAADAAAALAAASAAGAGPKASPAAAAAAAAAAAGDALEHTPRLFSFLTAEGLGVEAYFRGAFLCVEAAGADGTRAAVHFPRPLQPRCWRALAVEGTLVDVRLFIDGCLVDIAPLTLPRVTSPLAFACIGTNPPAAMAGLQRRRRQCALYASLGPVYIFSAPVGATALHALARRGPDHMPAFGAGAPPPGAAGGYVSGGYAPTMGAGEAAALDAQLAPVLLQCYHPQLGLPARVAPDVSPRAPPWLAAGRAVMVAEGPSQGPSQGPARKPRGALALGGVSCDARAPLPDALWAIGEGGPSVLLVLVPPALHAAPSFAPAAGKSLTPAAAVDATLAAATAIRCIAHSAAGQPAVLHAMARAAAPRALAALLPALWAAGEGTGEEASDDNEALEAAQAEVANAVAILATVAHGHEPLARQAYAELVLELRPWAGATRAAQRRVMQAAAEAGAAQPGALRAMDALRRLLAAMAGHLASAGTGPSRGGAALLDDAFVACELLVGAGADEPIPAGTSGTVCTSLDAWRADMRALCDYAAEAASGDARTRPQAARALLLLARLCCAPSAARQAAAVGALTSAGGVGLLFALLRGEGMRSVSDADASLITAGCARLLAALAAAGQLGSSNIPPLLCAGLRFALQRSPGALAHRAAADALTRAALGLAPAADCDAMDDEALPCSAVAEALTPKNLDWAALQTAPPLLVLPELLAALLPTLSAAPPRRCAAVLRDTTACVVAAAFRGSGDVKALAVLYSPAVVEALAAMVLSVEARQSDCSEDGFVEGADADAATAALVLLQTLIEAAARTSGGWRTVEVALAALHAQAALAADLTTPLAPCDESPEEDDPAFETHRMTLLRSNAALKMQLARRRAAAEAAASVLATALHAATVAVRAGWAGTASAVDSAGIHSALALLGVAENAFVMASAVDAQSFGDAAARVYGIDALAVAAGRRERASIAMQEAAARAALVEDPELSEPPLPVQSVRIVPPLPLLLPGEGDPFAPSTEGAFQGPWSGTVHPPPSPARLFARPPPPAQPAGDYVRAAAGASAAAAAAQAAMLAAMTKPHSSVTDAFGRDPFACPEAAPAWRAALAAAAALSAALSAAADFQPVTPPTDGSPLALLRTLPVRMLRLRLAVTELRASASDDGPDAAAGVTAAEEGLRTVLAPLLDGETVTPRPLVVSAAVTLYDELWAAARAAGIALEPPSTPLQFRVWRAGLAAPSLTFSMLDTACSASTQVPHGHAALGTLARALASLLLHHGSALAAFIAETHPLSRLGVQPPIETAGAPFRAATDGIPAATLRGVARAAPADGAGLFVSSDWAVALGVPGDAVPEIPYDGSPATAALAGSFTAAFSSTAFRARIASATAIAAARAASWTAFCDTWTAPHWSGDGDATRHSQVARSSTVGMPRLGRLSVSLASASTPASARAWRRLARRLSEGGALFAAGPPGSAEAFWRIDPCEDAARCRRRLRRWYGGSAHVGAAQGGELPATPLARISEALSRDSSSSASTAPDLGTPRHVRPFRLSSIASFGLHSVGGTASAFGPHLAAADPDATSPPEEPDPMMAEAADAEVDAAIASLSLSDASVLLRVRVLWITPGAATRGLLTLTRHRLTFTADEAPHVCPIATTAWPLAALLQIHARRFALRRSALELFFVARGAALFLDFGSQPNRRAFYTALMAAKPPALAAVYREPQGGPVGTGGSAAEDALAMLRPAASLALLPKALTQRWQRRQLSTFEYLMELNTLAGRSFNDISQWPVFPWVLQDYSSDRLDLSDPAVYRNLALPVGALEPGRAARFRERYASWEDGEVPPFHYGSHYSSAGVVLYYLVRLEPFTSLAIEMQEGRLDLADRLFHDVAGTWRGVTTSMADVKELTPEWFSLPEMFLPPANGTHLGTRQDGAAIQSVRLPPWAADAYSFVRQHREALESEHVSAHLHKWIDLIFGCKQLGPAAVAAQNMFHQLTYEGAVDVAAIRDPVLRQATEAQIAHFGQTPSQLLTRPHPPRAAASLVRAPLLARASKGMPFLLPLPAPACVAPLALFALPTGFAVLSPALQLLTHTLAPNPAAAAHAPPFSYAPPLLPAPPASADALSSLSALLASAASALVRVAGSDLKELDEELPVSPTSRALGRPPRPGKRPDAVQLVPGQPCVGLACAAQGPRAGSFAMSREGTLLLAGGGVDGCLRIYAGTDSLSDASPERRLRCLQSVSLHRGPVTAVALSECGCLAVAASADCTVSTWLLGGAPSPPSDGGETTAAEHAVRATAAAAALAAGEAEGGEAGDANIHTSAAHIPAAQDRMAAQAAGDAALLTAASHAPPLRGPLHVLRGLPEPPASVAVCASTDTVAACSPLAGLALWSLLTGRLTRRVPAAPGDLVVLTAQGFALVADPRARLLRCVSLNGALVAAAAQPSDEGCVTSLAAAADGTVVAVGSTPEGTGVGRVTVREVPSLRELYRFAIPEGTGVLSLRLLEGTLLLVGLSSGALLCVCDPTPPPPPLRNRRMSSGAVQYD